MTAGAKLPWQVASAVCVRGLQVAMASCDRCMCGIMAGCHRNLRSPYVRGLRVPRHCINVPLCTGLLLGLEEAREVER